MSGIYILMSKSKTKTMETKMEIFIDFQDLLLKMSCGWHRICHMDDMHGIQQFNTRKLHNQMLKQSPTISILPQGKTVVYSTTCFQHFQFQIPDNHNMIQLVNDFVCMFC